MTNEEAIELLNKALGCVQTDPRNCGECKKCKNYATKEDGIEAIRTALAALEKVPTALDHIHNVVAEREYQRGYKQAKEEYDHKLTEIKSRIKDRYYNKGYEQGKADAAPKWIPVTKDLPKTTDPVEITWVNHDPEVYYSDIKDKPFTGAACYYNGKWWWYSCVCQDFLDEYGKCDMDAMDNAIEVTAWKPFSEPLKGE